jgi:hypothetical protein
MKRIGIVAVVLWAMSGGVVWPTNAGAQSSQTIYACVDRVNGNVRIVSAGAACRTNEYSTQWNIAERHRGSSSSFLAFPRLPQARDDPT